MITIGECLLQSQFLARVSDSPRLDTELLLAAVTEKDRTYLYTWPEKTLTEAQFQRFCEMLKRREAGEPIAYILGYREFWSLSLLVNRATLIPRPETELLVETALSLLPETDQRVLDMGTGTGAIALALASERPAWRVTAVDNQAAAVELAIENCRRLNLMNVAIAKSHWFDNLPGERFNLIVSNPPYVEVGDPHLQQGDVRFEPHSALVSGDDGMEAIRYLIAKAPAHLLPEGWLLLEHGYDQAALVREHMQQAGFTRVASETDLAGHERATLGQIAL